jgi:hypothetical protein
MIMAMILMIQKVEHKGSLEIRLSSNKAVNNSSSNKEVGHSKEVLSKADDHSKGVADSQVGSNSISDRRDKAIRYSEVH